MRRVYTRTGDRGTTGIRGGQRVEKDDVRIEANGTLDELNAVIGIVRSLLGPDDEWQEMLHDLQEQLMIAMSRVATPSALHDKNPNRLPEALAAYYEKQIDGMMEHLADHAGFVLPGGTPVAAQLHFARTVARRAERLLWTLNREDAVEEAILMLVNRLSDLFFVMARYEMHRQGQIEKRWKSRTS